MTGRTASECRVFWNNHSCLHNPSINRSKSWDKQECDGLKLLVKKYKEYYWIKIAQELNVCNI